MNITGINPSAAVPGDQVTILGSGLADCEATFASVEADTIMDSDTGLVCNVPNLAPGVCTVVVTNASGSESASILFTVISNEPPMITDFFPDSGAPGTEVTINGSGFSNPSLQVFFDGTEADEIDVQSDTSIMVAVPEGANAGDITVETGAGMYESASPFNVEPDTVARSSDRRTAKVRAQS